MNEALLWILDLVRDVDPVARTLLAGTGIFLETSLLVGLIVPGDTITGIVGRTLPRVVGVLRPVNIGSFNVWIIYPRSTADLTLQ